MHSFSDVQATYIIAFCPDTRSFFVTNERYFYYEYDKTFETEEDGIRYFLQNIKHFLAIQHEILSETGGWSPNADNVYLENTERLYTRQNDPYLPI